ncbi:Mu transposase C-terminal domain-containing protein [Arthrobacter sp. 2RAF6]|uniref:Mu transposase C-terminal domain-containing protein n=1 Tax=Arthrobacter sp. 2RAF6 TaxID=3233002 RepID=UPI003F9260F0
MADPTLRVGGHLELHGQAYRLLSLNGNIAVLTAPEMAPTAVNVHELFADPSFKPSTRSAPGRQSPASSAIFEALPPDVQHRARWLEAHITEVIDGLPVVAEPGSRPRPAYDPVLRTLRQRELAKHEELIADGESLPFRSFQRLRAGYQQRGITALVDQRLMRRTPVAGRVDSRVVEVLLRVLEENTNRSSGTMDRLFREVKKRVAAENVDEPVSFPSLSTFRRLVARLREGRHATGSARTRRTLDQQPDGPFGAVYPVRPGELMQIDSTPVDIAVELGPETVGRVELTALVDIATRSICAAVLRPTTKAVDAALLLARCMTPELMRPGWPEAVSMAASALPYRSMRSVDERLEGAAAKPVIMPETIVCDHGKAYLSAAFKNACHSLGISLQPAHPDTPTDKPVVERTLQSVGTLFAQYVTGYLGSSIERRGKNAEHDAVFSVPELQDLLDEWIITGWQNRPHEGLRDPFTPDRVLTPNEKYAALLAITGYVPVPLSGTDYIELLPAQTRVINSYGIKIRHRIYDAKELNPYRGQASGIKALNQLWEIHYDPYDITRIWIRNHHDGGWITAYWRHLNAAPQPFGEAIWERGRQIVAERGVTGPSQATIAAAVDDLLDRASPAPNKRRKSAKDKRTVARQAATTEPSWPRPPAKQTQEISDESTDPYDTPADHDDAGELAKIIPLKIYDARKEAEKWW